MPRLEPFALERYFARYEFAVRYLLSPSDCESLSLTELLQMADAEGLRLWQDLVLSYTESPGHPLLREQIAGLYTNVPAGRIVVAVPEEAIYVTMHTLLEPGDHVVCVSPAYQSLYELARSIGCPVTPWRLTAHGDRWQLSLGELESAITERTRLLIVNFPHNPTGYLPSDAEFASIVELARRRNLYLFSDEMYRLLEYDPQDRLPSACDVYERAISLSGLSKTFALPGLRLGWLASQDAALPPKWVAFKDYTTICNDAPSEVLGIIALRAADRIIARNLEIVRSNLELAERFFADRGSLFEWLRPQAGSVAFPRWLGQPPIDELCAAIVKERGVMIVPGSLFGYAGGHFRIGLGRRNCAEALAELGSFVAA